MSLSLVSDACILPDVGSELHKLLRVDWAASLSLLGRRELELRHYAFDLPVIYRLGLSEAANHCLDRSSCIPVHRPLLRAEFRGAQSKSLAEETARTAATEKTRICRLMF